MTRARPRTIAAIVPPASEVVEVELVEEVDVEAAIAFGSVPDVMAESDANEVEVSNISGVTVFTGPALVTPAEPRVVSRLGAGGFAVYSCSPAGSGIEQFIDPQNVQLVPPFHMISGCG